VVCGCGLKITKNTEEKMSDSMSENFWD
jgi:hypothetical protein